MLRPKNKAENKKKVKSEEKNASEQIVLKN